MESIRDENEMRALARQTFLEQRQQQQRQQSQQQSSEGKAFRFIPYS